MIEYIKLISLLQSFREVINDVKHEDCWSDMKSISEDILDLLGFEVFSFILEPRVYLFNFDAFLPAI